MEIQKAACLNDDCQGLEWSLEGYPELMLMKFTCQACGEARWFRLFSLDEYTR